jgi:hypothetical protein
MIILKGEMEMLTVVQIMRMMTMIGRDATWLRLAAFLQGPPILRHGPTEFFYV